MSTVNLLSNLSRVEVPFIKVIIGDYVFGVQEQKQNSSKIEFPNYVQSLSVQKINGTVNQYTLNIVYPINEYSDPNYFEKVFSSVSQSRKIVFSYGDLSTPTFTYRNEQAIITKITSQFAIDSSTITYNVSAVSSCALLIGGSYNFPARTDQPSSIIKEILYDNKTYGLQDVFYGMRNKAIVEENSLIASNDKKVKVEMKTNISILDYLSYLVSCMAPVSDVGSSLIKNNVYSLVVVDDTSGKFDGPYFKVIEVEKDKQNLKNLTTYEIDVGYPSTNTVISFQVNNNENYSILYNYSKKLNRSDYVTRIGDNGKLVQVYAPIISSNNNMFKTTEADKTWWTKVTSYPVQAVITLKGLLRPALLMTYVKLNVLFYGQKHISSGTYIITKQVDTVDENGFKTQLNMTRISGDTD